MNKFGELSQGLLYYHLLFHAWGTKSQKKYHKEEMKINVLKVIKCMCHGRVLHSVRDGWLQGLSCVQANMQKGYYPQT